MPRMVWTTSIFGHQIKVQEGTIQTRTAYEQWNGWYGKGRVRRPGLREQFRSRVDSLEWIADRVDRMIDAGLTYESYDYDDDGVEITRTTVEKVIDDYDEECFYESLEDLRDSLNDTLEKAKVRRPLQRRIALLQQMIDLKSEPEDKANAQGRIDVLNNRLEAGER